ncbi:putative ABC transport system permease protein [Ruminococcus flavefaciens]|uniref:Putative ABC transport system permease protein n=1 Tax=Ruminococcus flavefaciens TaxID=1265 RepID=A0A1H6KH12_RUMFL|nr:ABC transporter permease [Ruminococcus flavefaciens]SEH71978.1 putative ABC transport system permease protein [Ruminococcus flavefaciens]
MDKILRKRLLRDLRANFGRYLALFLLITMGIYLVVSIVGASEMIIQGTDDRKSVNMVEDGRFTVFLPLIDEDISDLTADGTQIEPMFSLDLKTEDNAVLRMFRTRENIDLIQLDEGRLASEKGEAVIEKGYASAHELHVGDTVKAGGTDFTITGIGSVPDYDMCIAHFSDTAVERSSFGLLFITAEQYDELKNRGDLNAEEYTYAYRLGNTTSNELKDKIRGIKISYEQVEDKYFRETIDEILDERNEIEDGVKELNDGSDKLSEGLAELSGHSSDMREAADNLFEGYLSQANSSLAAMGQNMVLTEENYHDTLENMIALTHSEQLAALMKSLDDIAEFKNGIYDYTEGADSAADGAAELADGTKELKEKTDELLDELFEIDIENLTSFVTAEDNIRIAAAAGDVVMDRNAGLIAGVIVLALFAYVISVFVVHQIEQEQSVIGALYALGVKKKNLMRHYITMPTLIALIAAVIGAVLGFSPIGVGSQSKDTYSYFSIPEFDTVYPLYLIAYAIVLPPVICAVVNAFVINKKLSRTALSLMRNEQSAGNYRQFKLKTKSFPKVFAIRQLVRESRSALTMVLGMLVAIIVIMLGLDCYVMCSSVRDYTVSDTKYEYQYLYKYPENTVPDGGEAAYIETLSTDCMGYTLDVTVIGIDGKSRYFDAKPEKGKTKAVINSSLVERYGYKVGDRVVFSDSAADADYSFTVTDISDYSVGFTIFMDIGSMRELFGQDEDYFNTVYSDKELDIDEGRLYSVTTKDDIERSASVFVKLMFSLVSTLIAAGSVIFCVVMYLMLGVMIDRSAMGISLIKIFGYRPKEIRSLYLNGNLLVVAVGAVIAVPLAKKAVDMIFPSFIPNVACSMKLAFPWYLYVLIYCAVILIYAVINRLLMGKIKKISPAEVLKNRE